MMKEWKSYLVVALGLAVTMIWMGTALAEDQDDQTIPDVRQARLLERFGSEGIDANSDATLTRDEVRSFFADRPGDGLHGGHGGKHVGGPCMGHGPGRGLDGCGPARILKHHPEADLDGDGTLSGNEKEAFRMSRRAAFLESHPEADLDEDGVLSDEEARAAHPGPKGHCGKHGGPAGGCHGPGKGPHGPTPAQILEHHPEADLDSDGSLSESELETFHANLPALILERHPEADVDGDGTLSDDEMHSFMRERHGCGGKGPGCDGGCPGHGACAGHGECGCGGKGPGAGCGDGCPGHGADAGPCECGCRGKGHGCGGGCPGHGAGVGHGKGGGCGK